MKYQISELIDLEALRELMESLYRATGINHALIDNDSRVLTATGWEPVCTGFHRRNPDTCKLCEASDRHILQHLHDGPYVSYQCPNGLIDYATPLIIDGEHVASIFTGQMFHAPPDLDSFRQRASRYGFDQESYLDAVSRVRIVPRERMPEVMAFLVGLAQTLGQQGLGRLRQLEAEKELRQLNQELSTRVLERTRELQEKNQLLSQIIVEHERTEADLQQEKQFSDDIINSLPGVFYVLDTEGRFVRWNRKFAELSGYHGPGGLGGMSALDLFDEDVAPLVQERIVEVFERGESSVEAPLRTRDGRRIHHYFTGRRTRLGEQTYLVGLGIDITARRVLEEELEKQAHEDSLTGMATRRRFFDLAERELARSRRYGSPLSFLMVDIDQFKEINDQYGHGLGDLVLQRFAGICRNLLREVDVIGRIGGDEFAILLPETESARALAVGERLRASFGAMSMDDAGGPIRCTVSIGVATLGDPGGGIEALFDQADAALYRAKKEGRNRCAAA